MKKETWNCHAGVSHEEGCPHTTMPTNKIEEAVGKLDKKFGSYFEGAYYEKEDTNLGDEVKAWLRTTLATVAEEARKEAVELEIDSICSTHQKPCRLCFAISRTDLLSELKEEMPEKDPGIDENTKMPHYLPYNKGIVQGWNDALDQVRAIIEKRLSPRE